MRTNSIQVRLGIAFSLFLVLIVLATIAIFKTADSQKTDGNVINLSGKQRMLSQKMTKESFEIVRGILNPQALEETANRFSTVLEGLKYGNKLLGLPPTEDPRILMQLEKTSELWRKYKAEIDSLISISPRILEAASYIHKNNEKFYEELETLKHIAENTGKSKKVLDLINHLHHLTQQIAKEAMMVINNMEEAAKLKESEIVFEEIIVSLLRGNPESGIKPMQDDRSRAQLGVVKSIWDDFHRHTETIAELGVQLNESLGKIENLNVPLLKEIDKVVIMYQKTSEKKAENLKTIIISFLLIAVAVTLISIYLVQKYIVRSLMQAVGLAHRISDGDLTNEIVITPSIHSVDEMETLAVALNTMCANLRSLIGGVQESSTIMQLGSKKLAGQAEEMMGNIDVVNTSVGDTSVSITEMSKVAENIDSQAEDVARSTESVSASIEEMSVSIRGNEPVAEKLTKAVENSSTSIEETAAAIVQVAKFANDIDKVVETNFQNINDLYQGIASFSKRANTIGYSVEEVFTSMEELSVSIKEVANNSEEAQKLSSNTSNDALKGRETLSEAIKSIESIRRVQGEATKIIHNLSDRTDDIGNIVTVIDEIAEQTNLLALNAAIEAARAGEHGRGFAVVAEEVRKLAERTSLATNEIAGLIDSVQKESKIAVSAMEGGSKAVEQGALLAENSGKALNTIISGVEKNVSLAISIAKSTEEQESAASHVAEAINRVSEQAEEIKEETRRLERKAGNAKKLMEEVKDASSQIASSTNQQSVSIEQISSSILGINDVAQQVLASSKELIASADQIVKEVNSISEQIRQIKNGTDEQSKGVKVILEAMEKLASSSNKNNQDIEAGTKEIKLIADQAENLEKQIGHFNITSVSPKAIAPSRD